MLTSRFIFSIFNLIILCFNFFSFGQENQPAGILSGKVLDAETKTPLYGVNVLIQNTDNGAASDFDGSYKIEKLLVGNYSVVYSYIGYEKFIQTDVIIKLGRITYVNVELKPGKIEIENVVVSAGYFRNVETQPVSLINFSSEEVRRSPGSAGDVSRIMLNLPSLAKVNDTKNSLIVRGGSPLENAFYIDNIEIPNINHYPTQGSSDGPIGLINVDFIKDVNFYSGGFNTMYGDKLSSIMEMRYREGNRKETDTQIDLSFQGVGVSSEGPINNGKGSWLFGLRRSYFDMIFQTTDINGPIPTYYDFQGKVVYDLSQNHKLSLINIFSFDKSKQTQDEGVKFESNYFGKFDMVNNTSGINWQYLWGGNGFSNTSVSHTFMKYEIDNWETRTGNQLLFNESTEQIVNFRNSNNYRINSTNRIEFGIEAKYLFNKYAQTYFTYTDRFGNVSPEIKVLDNFNTFKTGMFAVYNWKPFDAVTINPAVRIDYFGFNKHFLFSPRASIQFELNEKTSFTASTGLYHQNLPIVLLAQNNSFKELKDPYSIHYIIGLNHLLSDDTRLILELYRKEYNNFPMDDSQPAVFLIDRIYDESFFSGYTKLLSNGKAYSQGIEAMIQKKLAKDFYGLISLSYFRAKYKDLNGIWRNRIYDNKYSFTIEGGYKPNEFWEFSLRWIYAGGAPYTPFNSVASKAASRGIYNESEVNSERLPVFHSLNLRIDKRFYFEKSNLVVFLSVWNAYDRKNVWTYSWNEINNEIKPEESWSTMPVFGLEFEF